MPNFNLGYSEISERIRKKEGTLTFGYTYNGHQVHQDHQPQDKSRIDMDFAKRSIEGPQFGQFVGVNEF